MVTYPTTIKKIYDDGLKITDGTETANVTADNRLQVETQDCGMPTPSTGQTLIMKTVSQYTGYQTIHTVTAGKTFYLMGVFAPLALTGHVWDFSFDGGTTVHLHIRGTTTATEQINPFSLSTRWPLAEVSAGTEIQVKSAVTDADVFVTIWGWEE